MQFRVINHLGRLRLVIQKVRNARKCSNIDGHSTVTRRSAS